MDEFFQNIQGQDAAIKTLTAQLQKNMVSHAYLFCGPAGCGKLNLAKAFSKAILQPDFEKLSNEEFNSQISSKIQNETLPDVQILRCAGAREYLVQQIRQVVDGVQRRPAITNHKIFIICEAEKLGRAGANALLKTLEEPPAFVHLVLLTSSADAVLPTIASRCQVVKLKCLPQADAEKFVMQQAGCVAKDAKAALELFGGDTGKAINFCVSQEMLDLYDEVKNIYENQAQLTDWDLLTRSGDVCAKIDEICKAFADKLADEQREAAETLDHSAVKQIERKNKRAVNNQRTDVLAFICAALKQLNMNRIKSLTETGENKAYKTALSAIDKATQCEQMLRYNISARNFCDALFLTTKEA